MKLNVGSGKRYELGYINIDLHEDILADKRMSAINLEFADNSCEEVKAIHLIEHLGFFKSLYALSEFFRVLQLNGYLVIETPDIEKAFRHYLNSNYEQKKEILGWIFGIPHEGLQHKLCYPSELLVEMLKKIGFVDMKEKRFYNIESIPTLRIQCKKSSVGESIDVFQIMTHIRKNMLIKNIVDFKDSFLTKEQEDLLTLMLLELMEFEKKKNNEIIFELIKNSTVKSPQIAELLLAEIENKQYLPTFELKYIHEIIDYLIRHNFPNILYNSLKNAPIIPGTQKFVFSSIEIFGKRLIDKFLTSKNEKEKLLNNLKDLSRKYKNNEVHFFTPGIVHRKSQDFFFRGIKEFYNNNLEISKKKLLTSIRLFRNDFLYYWNFAKVLFRLDLKPQALKFYKRTLRLLRISEVKNKKKIKNDINLEINWIKKGKGDILNFKPVISIDKYLLNE